MSKYRLLAVDIDGTLVNRHDELTPATREAIARAQAHGIHVVLATGRRYRRALPLVESLSGALPLVTAAGALIKRPADHRTLFRAEFAADVLSRVCRIVARRGFEPILYADTFDQGFDYYCRCIDVAQEELAEFFQYNVDWHCLYPNLLDAPPSGVFAGFAMGTEPQMLALMDELQAELPEALYVHVLRSPRYRGYMCEIAPAGVDKWSGIRHVASLVGVADDAICAVGDDVNDIPMIRGAGLGVAMGNALPAVKAAADRVAPCHNSDGLVAVVDWLLE